MTYELVRDDSQDDLADRLAAAVADNLRNAINDRGRATLAVPGGSTPRGFLSRLGAAPLAWSKVVVMPTDERWVPADHPRSNHRLVKETLFTGSAAEAKFLPLYRDAVGPEQAVPELANDVEVQAMPLDVCVLGMGTDMHTASLFPDAGEITLAMDPACSSPVMAMHAPEAGEPRITLTARALSRARQIHLLIHGEDKMAALHKACKTADRHLAPVAAVLDCEAKVSVWYAPEVLTLEHAVPS